MTNGKKSRKLLLIATVLTIAALASVLVVYASVTLFTTTGGPVTVLGVTSGQIEFATSNTGTPTWSTALSVSGTSWYAEIVIGSGSTYKGPVTISWQLQSYETGSWVNDGSPVVTGVTTSVSLTGGTQTIYASPDGLLSDATNWNTVDSTATTYQIVATVASA